MQRKKFIATTMAALPLFSFSQLKYNGSRSKKPFKVEARKSRFGEEIKFRGVHPNDNKISGKDTENQLSVFEYTGYEKTGPSFHVHFSQDEIFYVVEGQYRFVVGEETIHADAGDTIFLPRNIPHSWIQLTDIGKLIYFLQPAGNMEDFFRKMSSFKVPPTEKEIKEIHLAHGMKVLGPPLTL